MTRWRSLSKPRSSNRSAGRTLGASTGFVQPLSGVTPYAYNRPEAVTRVSPSTCSVAVVVRDSARVQPSPSNESAACADLQAGLLFLSLIYAAACLRPFKIYGSLYNLCHLAGDFGRRP